MEAKRLLEWSSEIGLKKEEAFPAELITKIEVTYKAAPSLSDVLELLNTPCESPLQIRNALMLRVAYLSGVRPTALGRITLADLREDGIWLIGKKGKRYFGVLDNETLELLFKYIANVLNQVVVGKCVNYEGLVFPSFTGHRLTPQAFYHIFRQQLNSNLSIYSLRHGMAQGMYNGGASCDEIIERLGHKGIRSVLFYVTENNLGRTRAVLKEFHPIFSEK
jgi:integrase